MYKKWGKRLLIVLLVLEGLYLVLGNVFLNTAVAPALLHRKPEKLLVEWRAGWTIVPGWTRVYDLRLRGQNRKLQWYAELESVWVECRLLALIRRSFHADQVVGQGLRFYLRIRHDARGSADGAEDRSAKHAAAPIDHHELDDLLPEIPGLDNPPDPVPEEIYPPVDKSKRGWHIVLGEIRVAAVRELWIERQHFVGEGQLAGKLDLLIRGPLEVKDTLLELGPGKLLVGDEATAESLVMALETHIEPFVPQDYRGRGPAFLRFFSGNLQVKAPRADFGFLDTYFRGVPWLSLAGEGDVDVDLGLHRGILTAGSRAEIREAAISIDALDFAVRGEGQIQARVNEQGDGVESIFETELDTFDVSRRDSQGVLARGADLRLNARTAELDLAEPRSEMEVEVDLPESTIPDLAAWNIFLPASSGFQLVSGAGRATGRFDLSNTEGGEGYLEIDAEKARARFEDLDLRGQIALRAQLSDADLAARRFELAGTRLELRDVAVGEETAGEETGDTPRWWARLEVKDGHAVLAEPISFETSIHADLKDSQPLVSVLTEKKPLVRWIENLLTVADLSADGRMSLDAGKLAFDDCQIRGEDLEILMHGMRVGEGQREGLFFFQLGPLSAAVELADGERDWKLTGSRQWYEQRASELTR